MGRTGSIRAVVNDGPLIAGGLIPFDILVQGFNGAADERLGTLLSMFTLRQFNEESASRKKRIGKSLLEGPESITTFFHRSAEFDPMRFPFTADRLDVVDFECDMLNALTVLLDEVGDL